MTLEQCTAIALKTHPSLQTGRAAIEASKAKVEQALTAYYPKVDLNSTYSTSTYNFITSGGAVRTAGYDLRFSDLFSIGPSLHQTLLDFGRTSSNVTIQRENVKASQEDLEVLRQEIILNVKQAYFGVLLAQRLIGVAEDTVNQMKAHLEQARGFFQAGTRPKIDVTKAEVDLASAELALIRRRNDLQVAQVALNNAMGLPHKEERWVLEDTLDFKAREITLEEILHRAYSQRSEIHRLRAKQRSQEAVVELQQASYYPTLSGTASYLYRGEEFNHLYWDWFFGVTLSIPLFSGFSSSHQVAEAQAGLRGLQAQEETLKLSIRLEAEGAYIGLKEAAERIRTAEKAMGHAQENFELARGRYRVGVGSPLEVTDAEVLLANARAGHIQALYDYKVAEAKIDRAMGMGR